MKAIIFLCVLLSFAAIAWFPGPSSFDGPWLEVRSGDWPITLERNIGRSDTSYNLIFRDQQFSQGTVLDTLPFPNTGQLKYFGQALQVLSKGNNGDIAKFKDYSVKRADKKYEGIWYILRMKWGLTSFQQPEANLMEKAIRNL